MADLGEGEEVAAVVPFAEGGRVLVASTDGRGFVVAAGDLAVGTRKGKALLSPTAPAKAKLMVPAVGDHVAVVSNDRHMAVFPLVQVPEMARGKGVKLQRTLKGVADVRVFALAEGLPWRDAAGKDHVLAGKDLLPWLGNRADRGRTPPRGFRKDNRFGP
jgi:topoisomerase-4 subunit A